jgi:predicted DNA-binding transcriptional regulator YafY
MMVALPFAAAACGTAAVYMLMRSSYGAVGEGARVRIYYTNWKGATGWRTVRPLRLWYGSTEHHKQEQWILTAFDLDKQAERDFAMRSISTWE